MARKWLNNFKTVLATGLLSGGTTITFPTGVGAQLNAITFPADYIDLTIDDGTTREIVKVTAHTTGADTATILRAQDGTTATAFGVGATVECRVTRAQLQGFALSGGGSAPAPVYAEINTFPILDDPFPGDRKANYTLTGNDVIRVNPFTNAVSSLVDLIVPVVDGVYFFDVVINGTGVGVLDQTAVLLDGAGIGTPRFGNSTKNFGSSNSHEGQGVLYRGVVSVYNSGANSVSYVEQLAQLA